MDRANQIDELTNSIFGAMAFARPCAPIRLAATVDIVKTLPRGNRSRTQGPPYCTLTGQTLPQQLDPILHS
jgi:hypothetical protein